MNELPNPFIFLKAISETKENFFDDNNNTKLIEKSYKPFLVNRGLSLYIDTILHVNNVNLYHLLDKKLQFIYLLNSIRQRKRYSKWPKNELSGDIKIISEYYKYSYVKAKQVHKLIPPEQLKTMKEKLEKGGLKEEKDGDNWH
jgi:hypothetical protein